MKHSFGGLVTLTVCIISLTLLALSLCTQFVYREFTLDLLSDGVSASANAASGMTELMNSNYGLAREQLCV